MNFQDFNQFALTNEQVISVQGGKRGRQNQHPGGGASSTSPVIYPLPPIEPPILIIDPTPIEPPIMPIEPPILIIDPSFYELPLL